MNRDEMLQRLEAQDEPWDIVIIGGGATGIGCAVDAASRGYSVLLLEQHDFGKGTSTRSTKLAHGGVRYLQQGNVSLVLEALRERGILRQNAPHLVHDLPFVVPNYAWWEAPFYGIGLRVYDMLAGRLGFGPSRNLSFDETLERLPTIETEGLRGGVIYYDGQFDDARLLLSLARTAAEEGAVLLNYAPVTGLLREGEWTRGVVFHDVESDTEYECPAHVVINATGAFSDSVRRLEQPDAKPMIRPSQGVHIVLDSEFLPGDTAIMVPHTDDGRVLFAIPWLDKVVVGTTDTPVDDVLLEPKPFEEELDFLLEHAARYLTHDPAPSDVRSAFAGLRPLVGSAEDGETSSISRDHTIHISPGGLLTIAGGKWTTYRKMAEDTIDQAAILGGLEPQECETKTLRIAGYREDVNRGDRLHQYGTHADEITSLHNADSTSKTAIAKGLEYTLAEVAWCIENEMPRTVEDILARRTRGLLLDARASIKAAPAVAKLLGDALGRDDAWQHEQVLAYTALAKDYLV